MQHNCDVASPEHPEDININAIRSETLNLQFPFSDFLLCGRESGEKFIHFRDISIIFLLLSKLEFSPWDVYLKNEKTGIMLHFVFGASLETLATKKFTIFCPFLLGAPYKIAFLVYALGKKVDSRFLPESWFENEVTAKHVINDLLHALFSLQLCLGLYDKRYLDNIKSQHVSSSDAGKYYEIDTKFVVKNHYGKKDQPDFKKC